MAANIDFIFVIFMQDLFPKIIIISFSKSVKIIVMILMMMRRRRRRRGRRRRRRRGNMRRKKMMTLMLMRMVMRTMIMMMMMMILSVTFLRLLTIAACITAVATSAAFVARSTESVAGVGHPKAMATASLFTIRTIGTNGAF